MKIIARGDERGAVDLWRGGAQMRPFLAGSVERAVMAANDMAVNATLRKDEWERVDARVNEEASRRLNVVDSFRRAGLIESVDVGDIERVTERLSAFDAADLSFDGETEPDEDRPDYQTDRRAIPIISAGFTIGFRQLASSQKRGRGLNVDAAGLATRAVARRYQALVTNGLAAGAPSGGGIPGLTTAANAIDVSLTANWDESGGDPIADVEAMLAAAYSNRLFGPFVAHIPSNYWAHVQGDYKAESDKTFIERMKAYSEIADVIPNDDLAADNVLLVQMTKDSIDISEALAVTTWQWQKTPAATHFRVLTIGGPHIKSIETEDGTTVNGIIHLS